MSEKTKTNQKREAINKGGDFGKKTGRVAVEKGDFGKKTGRVAVEKGDFGKKTGA
jgi:hypothetical protein